DLRKLFIVIDRVRPWTNQRHGTVEDIDQVRQLIKAGTPQDTPDTGYACIVPRRLHRPFRYAGLVLHGPELINFKLLVEKSEPLLAEQHRSLAFDLYREGDEEHQGQKNQDRESSKNIVLGPFNDGIPA